MKKCCANLLSVSFLFISALGFAKEPVNLQVYKQTLIQYHDSGEYDKDLNAVTNEAMAYLKLRAEKPSWGNKIPAIVLDIDETALSNYTDALQLGFGGTLADIQKAEDKGTDSVIAPTLKLFQFAKAHHIAVIFLTGRSEAERDITSKNLRLAGYENWDKLILRGKGQEKLPATTYKTAARKALMTEGYDILLSMGDQQSDLTGGYADKTFKLPNPYYFIP